jgi:hypothetical protein
LINILLYRVHYLRKNGLKIRGVGNSTVKRPLDIRFHMDNKVTSLYLCAKFEPILRGDVYHPLPGCYMDTLLNRNRYLE